MTDIESIFDADGPLAHAVAGYRTRTQQMQLAKAIADALQTRKTAVLEAGTGTGKTFAYLAPLLLSGAKTIISTSTKGLQDQLFQKDIPQILKALDMQAEVQLLKGRGNYICLKRLEMLRKEELGAELFEPASSEHHEIARIANYAEKTKSGDLAGLSGARLDASLLPWVTSTVDNCTGGDCEYFNKCFIYKARNRARNAQILVVNHALLVNAFAQGYDMGELFSGFDALVFDEAHQLLDVLPRLFAQRLGMNKLQTLLAEAQQLAQMRLPNEQQIIEQLDEVKGICEEIVKHAQSFSAKQVGAQHILADRKAVELLKQAEDRFVALGSATEHEDELGVEFALLRQQFDTAGSMFKSWQKQDVGNVDWLETDRSDLTLFSSPKNYAALFREHFVDKFTTVLISATLAVDGSMEHYTNRLGLHDASSLILDSPFDYARQAVLYLPQQMPDPRNDENDFVQEVTRLAAKLVKANSGGSFVLFSTWRNMRYGAAVLARLLAGEGGIMVQGDLPPAQLLDRLRATHGPRVLVGTRTFWQGVDVIGEALQLVVIDKIPFVPPSDPLLESELDQYPLPERAFVDVQVSQAALLLKQAAGRLIRSENDRGVLAICDPRITKSSYGEIIRRSLPAMTETDDLEYARNFLQNNHE